MFGLATRWAALVSSLMLMMFIIGIVSVWYRDIPIDTGWFGPGGYDPTAFDKYPDEIGRTCALLALSLFLVMRPHTRWSTDRVLFPSHTPTR